MRKILLTVVSLFLLQSCVEEIASPLNQQANSNEKYWLISGETEICFYWYEEAYLIYDQIDLVDSIQWDPSESLLTDQLGDTLHVRWFTEDADTANVSLLIFNEEDTSIIPITIVDCFQSIYIPSGFTPDGNGLNDKWYPVFNGMSEIAWKILSKDGEIIYENEGDLHAWWDGTWNGNPAPEGLYRYWIRYQKIENNESVVREGWIQLYRSE